MFTQCPECGSVFRVTADALRIAAGLVRCGVCQHEFDALAALTDDPGAAPVTDADATPADDGPPPFDDTITVEELGTGEVIELGAANDDVGGTGEDESPATAALQDSLADVATRTDAEEWLPESLATPDFDRDAEAGADAASTATPESGDSGDDAIEVNDSSVTGLEAIVLAGEDPTGSDDGDGAEPAAGEALDAGAATPAASTTPGVAAARGPTSTDDLEFHGSEEDLERVFVATGAPVVPEFDLAALEDASSLVDEPASAIADPDAPHAEPVADSGGDRPDLDRTDEFPILVLDERDEPLLEPMDAEPAGALDGNDADGPADEFAVTGGSSEPVAPIPLRDPRSEAAVAAAAPASVELPQRFAIPPELRRGANADDAAEDGDLRFGLGDDTPRWWERRAVWLTGSLILTLTLAAQAVHYNREALARDARLGPWVLRAYGLLGLPAPVPSDLAAIDLHQWGAASDSRTAGRLRLRASLVNHAPFAQPYPVLRVTLHDRFGNVLGSRDVGARDYLPGGASQRRLLAAGQRLDAEIVVVDPGSDAVGYEIDLCEEQRDGVRCRDTTPAPT